MHQSFGYLIAICFLISPMTWATRVLSQSPSKNSSKLDAAAAEKFTVPLENISDKNRPDFSSVPNSLKILIGSINSGVPEAAEAEFFPKKAFNELKDIRFPDRYHVKLVNWYFADIKKEHDKLKGAKLSFVSFKAGRCKFKKIGTEYNKIAYWSCYGSRFTVSDGSKEKTIKIKALINWGAKWFITHLGPIPKS